MMMMMTQAVKDIVTCQ